MATPTNLPALLDSLRTSVTSALEITPKLADIAPAPSGISLFDVKNELLLCYLQYMGFLILLRLRQRRGGDAHTDADSVLGDLVVKKLVELRLYLEKGVRPLEDKLRYQVEKVLRAAADSERAAKAAEAKGQTRTSGRKADEGSDGDEEEGDDSGEEEEEEQDDDEDVADVSSALRNRPNISAMVRASHNHRSGSGGGGRKDKDAREGDGEAAGGGGGVYRPPRLNPTVMPTTTSRRERAERRPHKSATLDEFIADEMSSAPLAVPSIGTTIAASGRKHKTAAEQREEQERRDYEETHFVRLPKETKKERAKKAKAEGGGRSGRMSFGGEEWRELGEGVDRINRLTKGKSAGTGTKALLEKSRKRGLDTTDGPRGSGVSSMGERYQKRLKVLEGGRRDRGKQR